MVYIIVLAVLICLAVLTGFMMAPRMEQRWRMRPFLGVRWAHRGLHDPEKGIPENSLSAFAAAIERGVGIELDVHLTKDGQLAVFHDDTFDRMCGQPGIVEETDYSVMKEYRLSGTRERIPLLSEVLSLINGKVPVLIEVKLPSSDVTVCRVLDEELRRYSGKYMIQSFNCLVLRWMKKYRKEVLRGQLSSNLTRSDKKPHYLLRLCVKYLLSNCFCRPDFIAYKWSDRKNLGFWINRTLFRTPSAAWTLHGERAVERARCCFDMYIFEIN